MFDEIIERLEAGKESDRRLDVEIADELSEWKNLGGHWEAHKVTGERRRTSYPPAPNYTASVDTALSLVPAGWGKLVSDHVQGGAVCELRPGGYGIGGEDTQDVHGRAATWPLAICAAALRARESTPTRPSPVSTGKAGG